MLSSSKYFDFLKSHHQINFYAGIPDSLLKDFCKVVQDQANIHTSCANEGSAIAQAIGHHLATGEIPFVYLQNSGFGNALNPLISMASESIYQIPILIMIGWRGEPGVSDEPQHVHQGKVMLSALDSLNFDYAVLPTKENEAQDLTSKIIADLKSRPRPYFLVTKKNTFAPEEISYVEKANTKLYRPKLIETLIQNFKNEKFFASTGYIGRELYAAREKYQHYHTNDFLSIGAMGHVSQMAYAYCAAKKQKVICLDGDGSLLMHMGGMSSIHHFKKLPIIHIVFNNAAHLSVGGQPTVAGDIDLALIAKTMGYQKTFTINHLNEFELLLDEIRGSKESLFANVHVSHLFESNLIRPRLLPSEMKELFMQKGTP